MTEPGDPTSLGKRIVARGRSPQELGGEHFAAPLGSSRRGSLRFTGGVHRLVIRSDPRVQSLYRARFGDRNPTIQVRGGAVTIRSTRSPDGAWFDCRSERPAEVELNSTIPWDIEIRGGASRLRADLRGLRLGSLRLEGGAGRIEVALPVPSDTVPVFILGGASNVAIRRPEGVSARLCVEGGVTNLTFDDRHIGATGGEPDLRSRGYEDATGRYAISITGGANNVSVESQPGTRKRGPAA